LGDTHDKVKVVTVRWRRLRNRRQHLIYHDKRGAVQALASSVVYCWACTQSICKKVAFYQLSQCNSSSPSTDRHQKQTTVSVWQAHHLPSQAVLHCNSKHQNAAQGKGPLACTQHTSTDCVGACVAVSACGAADAVAGPRPTPAKVGITLPAEVP
jgi:hypothetical protein